MLCKSSYFESLQKLARLNSHKRFTTSAGTLIRRGSHFTKVKPTRPISSISLIVYKSVTAVDKSLLQFSPENNLNSTVT